jgi:hypothetical protein
MCASVDYGDERVRDFIAHVIGTCHARQTDHITIAGRRAIQTVIDLCRQGYLHVMCRTAAPGPHVAEDPADSLWILNVPSETELRALIATLGPDLRNGGTLVVGFEASISSDHAARLRQVLLEMGFVPVRQEIDPAARALLICGQRQPRAHARAA